MTSAGAIAVVLCVLAQAAAGAEVIGAKGRFQSKDIAFDVTDAYAFRAKDSGGGEVLTVAVSNVGINEQLMDEWLDRKQAFEKRFKDDNAAVLYFDFSPDGRFKGISYYLGPGNGCGYCSSTDMKSAVKLSAGRLEGPFSHKGKDSSWDITLAVPVAIDRYGPALPAGGGAPGKAYLAWAAAVKGRDAAALRKLMVSRRLGGMAQAEKAGQLEDFLTFVGENRYVDTLRVVRGFATADHAVLAVEGEGPVGKRSGQVLLRKEPWGWSLDDEILE
jgi:hypothetical protein